MLRKRDYSSTAIIKRLVRLSWGAACVNERARVQTVVKAIEPRATRLSLFFSPWFSLPPSAWPFLKAHSLMSRIAGIVLPLRRGAEFFSSISPSSFFFHFNLACLPSDVWIFRATVTDILLSVNRPPLFPYSFLRGAPFFSRSRGSTNPFLSFSLYCYLWRPR